jgi:hypothetical protein
MRKFTTLSIISIMLVTTFLLMVPPIISAQTSGWKNDERLTVNDADSRRPDIAVDSHNNVHVVWEDMRGGSAGIYYKLFDGNSWTDDLRLDNPTIGGGLPGIAVDRYDNVHVVWGAGLPDEQIYYTMNDGGGWSTPLKLTTNSGIRLGWMPQTSIRVVTISNGNIYIFWTDASDSESMDIAYIFYNGIIWGPKQSATNDPRIDYDHFNPDVAVDSNDNLHLAYVTTDPSSNYFIHYRKFDGDSWSEEGQISDPIGICVNFPSISSDSINNSHVTWADWRDDPIYGELYYSKLDNEGNTLVNDLRLTNFPESSRHPCIIVDNQDNLHVVWFKGESQGSYSKQLYYTKLNNTGATSIDDLYLSDGQYVDAVRLLNPRLAIDSLNRLHVVFGDDRDGNLEIYYKGTYTQDLSINTTDIQFSNYLPKSNEYFYINATIHNNGEILTNGTVKLYKNSIEDANIIGSDTVSIPVSGTDTLSLQWSAISGVYNISVVIETETFVAEANLTNNIATRTIIINDPPTISITTPSYDVNADISYTISWVGNDPDDDAMIRLYYDTDNTGNDGTLIVTSDQYPSGIVDNNGASQSYEWNTTSLPDDSSWYIYAEIDDGIHPPVYAYSQGRINIDHPNIPPTVEITSPTGGTVSGLVTILGTADDPDKDNIESVFVSIDNMANWKTASGTSSWDFDWDTTKYSNGDHTIYAKAYDGEDSSEIVSVSVTVDNGGNIAPHVDITYPNNDATVSDEIEIKGSASDDDGFVQIVEIQIDNEGWREVTGTSNWNYDWDTTSYTNGEHIIKARAKDDLGTYSQEKTITVIVDNGGNILPNVQITSHSGGEVVSGTLQIKGTAVDHDGNVESVDVRIDSGNWNTASGTTSWIYEWDTTEYSNGEHVVYSRAKDDNDEYSQIKSVTLIVDNGGNIPPIVNIISPTDGTVSGTVTISGTASDLDGDNTIISVQVKIDEDWEYTDGITDWSYSWDTSTLDDGNYTIHVRAYDGNDYSLIKSIDVFVDNPHKPILTITSDIPDTASGTITIKGTASDSDGEVTKVEIQIDDGEWKEVEGTTDWSYELDTTKLSNGEHTIRIRVYDDEGEYNLETFNINVNNSNWTFWILLVIVIVLLFISLLILIGVKKRKLNLKSTPSQQPVAQTNKQTIRCPQCNKQFETLQSSAMIKCPYCGLSGTVK